MREISEWSGVHPAGRRPQRTAHALGNGSIPDVVGTPILSEVSRSIAYFNLLSATLRCRFLATDPAQLCAPWTPPSGGTHDAGVPIRSTRFRGLSRCASSAPRRSIVDCCLLFGVVLDLPLLTLAALFLVRSTRWLKKRLYGPWSSISTERPARDECHSSGLRLHGGARPIGR